MRRLLVLLLLAMLLAGCNDSDPDDAPDDPGSDDGSDGTDGGDGTDGSDGGDGTDGNGTGIMEPAEPRDPVTWNLDITDNAFPDGSITIQVGDTVTWTHRGTNPHTVTSDDGTTFHSGDCPGTACITPANPTYSYTFGAEGEFAYHCQIHGGMTGTITALERYDGTPTP